MLSNLFYALNLFIVGLVFIWLHKGCTFAVVEKFRAIISPLKGLLVIFVVPILVVFLLISKIGFGLGLLLLVMYCVLFFVSLVFGCFLFGRFVFGYLLKKKFCRICEFGLGVLVFVLLSLIPYIGWMFVLYVILAGFGTLPFAMCKCESCGVKKKEVKTKVVRSKRGSVKKIKVKKKVVKKKRPRKLKD